MKKRMQRQLRAIKRYAKSKNLSIDQAAWQWVQTGCAAKWATQN